MLSPTLIRDSSIVDKRLLDTTVIIRHLTFEALRCETSSTFGHIPRGLSAVRAFLVQTRRPTVCFIQKTKNNKGKDDSLLKAKEFSVKIVWFFLDRYRSFGWSKHLVETAGFHRFCFIIDLTWNVEVSFSLGVCLVLTTFSGYWLHLKIALRKHFIF